MISWLIDQSFGWAFSIPAKRHILHLSLKQTASLRITLSLQAEITPLRPAPMQLDDQTDSVAKFISRCEKHCRDVLLEDYWYQRTRHYYLFSKGEPVKRTETRLLNAAKLKYARMQSRQNADSSYEWFADLVCLLFAFASCVDLLTKINQASLNPTSSHMNLSISNMQYLTGRRRRTSGVLSPNFWEKSQTTLVHQRSN